MTLVVDGIVIASVYALVGLSWAAMALAVSVPIMWLDHWIVRQRKP
jgi:hypothetical protein